MHLFHQSTTGLSLMIAAILIVDLHEKLVLFAYLTLHTHVGPFSLFFKESTGG
jgi:hypothetical protein